MSLGRAELLGDRSLTGAALCRAYSERADRWLAGLLDAATDRPDGVALVAVGGYGRAELCPESDLDVLLLHDGRAGIGEVAEAVWYPVWDEGLKLGHAVRTVKEALTLAGDDLDTATAMLSLRHLAGDATLSASLGAKALEHWQRRSKRWLGELARRVGDRHAAAGEVAFLLEPDLKEGRGGLRDVHALRWAEQARRVLLPGDDDRLVAAYTVLLDTRVELHRVTGRPGDVLLLQEQDAVAEALGAADADALMADVAAAARTIAWTSDEAWERIGSSLSGPLGRIARRDRHVADGVVLRDGLVHLTVDADPARDPTLVLRAAVAAAEHRTRFDREALDRLAAEAVALPDPWPPDARDLLVALLLAGSAAIAVLEALDQRELLVRLLPEWAPVRSRPQRNAYHRFTVDRHLCEAAANAAALADRVSRPDLLVVGALLHDLGKGYPGDHTVVGMELLRDIGPRLGFAPDDVDILVAMVEHHLLLPDVATRRDLSDDGTIATVAATVGSPLVLELLAALTEADSLATGPSAWGQWKAGLVAELVARTGHVLGGGAAAEVTSSSLPTAAQRALLDKGEPTVQTNDDVLTVVTSDSPGLFAKVAGVLALNGLAVLEAAAESGDGGVALEVFRVESAFGPVIAWDKVRTDLDLALAGRLALQARLADRARTYRASRTGSAARPVVRVKVDNETTEAATVIEVHAPDAIGVLYRITRALADLDVDIRSAKAHTLGAKVVDAFYVSDAAGAKLTDPAHLAELSRAIEHALTVDA
ncbi:[protein-PII] uridylyltransferase [soil metagenome]